MIRFQIANENYAMAFSHQPNVMDYKRLNPRVQLGGSYCYIYAIEKDGKRNPEPVAFGASYLHPNDNLNKETGRKLSLSRALDDFTCMMPRPMAKKARTAVWQAYFNRAKQTQAA